MTGNGSTWPRQRLQRAWRISDFKDIYAGSVFRSITAACSLWQLLHKFRQPTLHRRNIVAAQARRPLFIMSCGLPYIAIAPQCRAKPGRRACEARLNTISSTLFLRDIAWLRQ